MVGGQVFDDEDRVVLVYLGDRHSLARIDWTAVFTPVDGEWDVSLDNGTGNRGTVSDVQRQDRRMERIQLRGYWNFTMFVSGR